MSGGVTPGLLIVSRIAQYLWSKSSLGKTEITIWYEILDETGYHPKEKEAATFAKHEASTAPHLTRHGPGPWQASVIRSMGQKITGQN